MRHDVHWFYFTFSVYYLKYVATCYCEFHMRNRHYTHIKLVQSLSITNNVVSSNHVHGEVYSIQRYVIKLVGDLRQVDAHVFSINKTDSHHITEISLKVTLSSINQTKPVNLWTWYSMEQIFYQKPKWTVLNGIIRKACVAIMYPLYE